MVITLLGKTILILHSLQWLCVKALEWSAIIIKSSLIKKKIAYKEVHFSGILEVKKSSDGPGHLCCHKSVIS